MNREYERLQDKWFEDNRELVYDNEQLLEYFSKHADIFKLFCEIFGNVLDVPHDSIFDLDETRYMAFISWFSHDSLRISEWESWLCERMPDFKPEYEDI